MLRVSDVVEEYERYTLKKIVIILTIFLLLFSLIIISASVGSYPVPLGVVLKTMTTGNAKTIGERVILYIRLPRILMAIIAGSALACAGAMTQGILRNPLATPYTLGVSSAAGLGAAIAILYLGSYAVIPSAFVFSLIPVFVILMIVKMREATPETMILAGIAMLYIFSAVTTLLMFFANPEDVKEIYFWIVGDLGKANWKAIPITLSCLTVCFLLLFWKTWDVNVTMITGDEAAKSLGVDPERLRIFVMIVSAFLTASIVSFTGTIGFICLVAPHMCRMIIGGDYRYLLPASTVFGGLLLLACDTIARTIMAPIVLPVGVITNCSGGPMFLYLLLRRRREYW